MSEEYNGWSNYETWNIKLWIDNDEGLYHHFQELARECKDSHELADQIEEWVEDNNPLTDKPSLYSDILGTSLRSADYVEIAESLLEDVEE